MSFDHFDWASNCAFAKTPAPASIMILYPIYILISVVMICSNPDISCHRRGNNDGTPFFCRSHSLGKPNPQRIWDIWDLVVTPLWKRKFGPHNNKDFWQIWTNCGDESAVVWVGESDLTISRWGWSFWSWWYLRWLQLWWPWSWLWYVIREES